jgi:alcohol dehydrogenase
VAIRKLAADIGIPASLSELGVKREDIPLLARNALQDACGLTNPRKASQAEIESIFEGAM